jgi:hypothetical protein
MLRSFIARLAATSVVPLALWLFPPRAGSAETAAIFDDLNEPAAWTGPVFQYGNPATGKAWFTNGVLTIRHSPVGRWHTVSMSRTWEADPRQGLWVHFRFRIREMLLGADLYATVSFGDEMVLQMGVNGEQHWVQGGNCQAKDFDDELFWGSNVIVGEEGKRTDIRVGLSEGPALRYTDWTLVSMCYEVKEAIRRIRLFVNGREVVCRDLDAAAPAGAVDNRVRAECLHLDKAVPVTVNFANFTDGDLYADTTVNKGDGIRWLHAFAANTPAKPHRSDPSKAEVKDSDMDFDFVLIHRPGETNALPETFQKLVRPTPLWRLLGHATVSGRQ